MEHLVWNSESGWPPIETVTGTIIVHGVEFDLELELAESFGTQYFRLRWEGIQPYSIRSALGLEEEEGRFLRSQVTCFSGAGLGTGLQGSEHEIAVLVREESLRAGSQGVRHEPGRFFEALKL